ncbi:TRAP transporter small permease [Variovorax paradoxus]|nr:TRAP transporter small permease [Variovorax paradoxus]MBT2301907.1 TRAP transporter small permease [Variovorax paradoxus]
MLNRLERWMARAAAAALVILMLIVLVDVIGRDIFNRPLAAGTELTELSMASMVFLAFPLLAFRQRDITVDLFDFLVGGETLRKLQVVLAGLVGTAVYGLLSRQMIIFAQRAALSGEATSQLGFPLTYAWWAMCALSALAALASLVVALAAFTRRPIEPGAPSETPT